MTRIVLIVLGAAALAGGLFAWSTARSTGGREAPSKPPLEATRISPPPESGAEVACEAFAETEFVYHLQNTTLEPIRGLAVSLACQCEATQEPPDTIMPGESARVGFKLRAPDAGVLRRQIELFTRETHEVLLSLPVALRVEFDPPALVHTPESLNVTFVDGDEEPRQVAFECVEERESEPWIESLEVEPEDLVEVVGMRIDETREMDPSLTRRPYRFDLLSGSRDVGSYLGSYLIRTRCDPSAMYSRLPLSTKVLDRVALIPNPVQITACAERMPGRLIIVRRAGAGRVKAMEWNRDLLDVRLEGAEEDTNTAVFAVTPKVILTTSQESSIVFQVDETENREVKVVIHPGSGTP